MAQGGLIQLGITVNSVVGCKEDGESTKSTVALAMELQAALSTAFTNRSLAYCAIAFRIVTTTNQIFFNSDIPLPPKL